jgi:hypothetical protein
MSDRLLRICVSVYRGKEITALLQNYTIPGNPELLRVTLAFRGNSASKNLQQETQQLKCCLYKTPYVAAPVRETGDAIARTPLYAQLPTDTPTRARFFLVHE